MNLNRENSWTGLAADLGASSGRVLSGSFDGRRLEIEEIQRFENVPVFVGGTLHWDFLRLFHEVKTGFRKGSFQAKTSGTIISSLGIDTWGVDFGLLNKNGELLGNPVHYRDKRTNGIMERLFSTISREDIFNNTGIQFLPFNTIFQLAAMKMSGSLILDSAENMLMIPDLFHYYLTGEKVSEFTNATTTQLYDPRAELWSKTLAKSIGIDSNILAPIIQPGTVIGALLQEVETEISCTEAKVVATATHDTGSAVAAVPAVSEKFAYISSGTWSLLGTESVKPIINKLAMEYNFTNEGGVGNTFRILKNIMGLWILQELRREWENQGKSYTWDELTDIDPEACEFGQIINPDDELFLPPGGMTERIIRFCHDTNQTPPCSDTDFVRCVIQSLALKYKLELMRLEELTDTQYDVIHIVGGGSQNRLLCQWTANACGKEVVAGPVEATAIGNLAVQLISAGEVSSLAQIRSVIAESFPTESYAPTKATSWQDAFNRYEKVLGKSGRL
jgi:rhamnulokinase